MRILFLTPDVEEKSRGIGTILKNLIVAAKDSGHEVGLLTGIPYKQAYSGNPYLRQRIEHIHLQHYLLEGRASFRYMIPGGYRKRNVAKKMLKLGFLEQSFMSVDKNLLSGKRTLAYNLDFIVRAPFIYQFIARNKAGISRLVLSRLSRAYDIDLVVAVSPTVLRSRDLSHRTQLVTFVHDFMPVEVLETPPDNNTPVHFASQVDTSAKYSNLLLTNSEDTAAKIKELNPKAKVDVVYGVVSKSPGDASQTAILKIKNLRTNRYLLFASTIEKRKNLEGLMEAYTLAYERIHMPLVLIGAPGYGFKEIVEQYESLPTDIKNNIIFTGYLSEEDKHTLFKHANSFVFPSFYEGFGLPVLEAMAYGLPVLTTNRGALAEAAGNAALYVQDPYNYSELTEGLIRISHDSALRDKLVLAGKKQLAKFSEDEFAKRVVSALDSLDKKSRSNK